MEPTVMKSDYAPIGDHDSIADNSSYPRRWTAQMHALLVKNMAILRHKKIMSCLLFLVPAVSVLLLTWLHAVIGESVSHDVALQIQPCSTFTVYGEVNEKVPCITLAYGPSSTTTDAIMTHVAESAGLKMGVDIVGKGSADDVAALIFDEVSRSRNVDAAVIFNETIPSLDDDSYQYEIWINTSSLSDYKSRMFASQGFSPRFLSIQAAVDEAIISHAKGSKASLHVSFGTFTHYSTNPVQNGDDASFTFLLLAAPAFLGCGIAVVSLLVLNVVVGEKSRELLGLLRNIGLLEMVHWLSWLAVLLPVVLIGGIIATAFGHTSSVILFKYCDFGVHVLAFFLYGTSMVSSSLFIASFVRQTKWVNLISFLIFAFSVIFGSLFPAIGLYDKVYSPSTPPVVAAILFFFPYFHYGRVIFDILNHIQPGSSGNGGGHAAGSYQQFTFADLGKALPAKSIVHNGHLIHWSPESPGYSLWMLFYTTILFLALAWYFGQVASGDLGASQRFYFPFSPAYWGCTRTKRTIIDGDTLAREQLKSLQEGSVRIHKLSKSYDKNTALKEVTLRMEPGKLTVLLGQNGAGKTTLVNCLSGLITPTHGEAFMFGSSVRLDVSMLRDVMGTCPQHDLLYEELSAYEHFQLFTRFKLKGATLVGDMDEHIRSRLEAVNLLDVAGSPVTTFSGGMKRRLSVGLSSVGSPKIIFLDEPTTGMDPLSRRRVWSLIQSLKKDKIVILTTHSMEEADALGDHVAILAGGKLRATGTPLFLKNRFGSGYSLSLLTTPDRREALCELVKEHLPGADIVFGDAKPRDPQIEDAEAEDDVDGESPTKPKGEPETSVVVSGKSGAVTVAVPRESTGYIPAFLRLLATHTDSADSEGDGMVKEFSIANSTLEEVFLKLAAQNRGVNWVDETANANAVRQCVLCHQAPPSDVTLFTTKMVAVSTDELICESCSQLEPAEVEAMRKAREEALAKGADSTSYAAAASSGYHSTYDSAAETKATESRHETDVMGRVGTPADGPLEIADERSLNASTDKASHRVKREPVGLTKQFTAILLLRLQLQAKQKKTNICYIVILLIAVLLIYVSTPKASNPHGFACAGGFFVEPQALCHVQNFTQYMSKASSFPSSNHYEPACAPRNPPVPSFSVADTDPLFADICVSWYDNGACRTCLGRSISDLEQTSVLNGNYPWLIDGVRPPRRAVWYRDAPTGDRLEDYNMIGLGPGIVNFTGAVEFINKQDEIPNGGFNQMITQSQIALVDAGQDLRGTLCNDYVQSNFGPYFELPQEAYAFSRNYFPDFTVDMSKADSAAAKWSYELRHYGRSDSGWFDSTSTFAPYNGYCDNYQIYPGYDSEYDNLGSNNMQAETSLNVINSALLRTITGTNATIRTTFVRMPDIKFKASLPDGAVGFQAFLVPLFVMLLMPSFVSFVATEKESLLFSQMKMAGLRSSAYWLASWIFCFVYTFIMTMVLFTLAFLFNVATFANTGFNLLFTLALVWSFASPGYAFFIGSVFRHSRSATILSYLLVVAVSIASSLLDQFLDSWSTTLEWMPLIGFCRAVGLILTYGGTSIESGSALQTSLLSTSLTGLIGLILGMYLHAVLPGTGENSPAPLHPLFFLDTIRSMCASNKDEARQSLLGESGSGASDSLSRKPEDRDVALERRRVEGNNLGPDASIVIRRLKKEFPGKISRDASAPWWLPQFARGVYTAVDNVSVSFATGCTGLLGPNGAGKTTTISILSGHLKATAGQALVGGFDVATEMDYVHRILGICPQFDTVFPDLTVKETLFFYGRLKNVPESLLVATVQQTAERVELDGDAFNIAARELSGGMRRRLSIGIALIGDPTHLFLDEPSTGLDPDTRRQIWDIIQGEKALGRCILLTTHSMEEAEALSDKIVIMCRGSVRVYGSPLHLKGRFGDGYKLSITLDSNSPAAYDEAYQWITGQLCVGAQEVQRVGVNLDFILPRQHVEVADLFEQLQEHKTRYHIAEYGLANSSLEQVFVSVVETSEQEEIAEAAARQGSA